MLTKKLTPCLHYQEKYVGMVGLGLDCQRGKRKRQSNWKEENGGEGRKARVWKRHLLRHSLRSQCPEEHPHQAQMQSYEQEHQLYLAPM